MKVLGLVAEYNPFHYGHKYHLQKSLSYTNTDYSIAVMSGSFVQRGEPSFVDKWTKAKMAVKNGVDLVIELPFVYASQSAELFALGAIRVLNALNIIDYLSFGSEEGNLDPLKRIAKLLLEEPSEFKDLLNYYLSLGNSFPVSRSLALENYYENYDYPINYDIKTLLRQSNNILGIEYLKALSSTKSNIRPVTIKRRGANYNDIETNMVFSSATGIRNVVLNKSIKYSRDLIPPESFSLLEDYIIKYKKFNTLENYCDIIRYLFLTEEEEKLKDLFDIDEGLENRIIKFTKKSNNIWDIISKVSTRRYPSTRIQRIFIHLLLKLKEEDIRQLYSFAPQYIRILASNQNGLYLLKKIKQNSNLKIITKFSNYEKYKNEIINRFLYFEKKATDIYFLGLNLENPLTDMDYYMTPYIE